MSPRKKSLHLTPEQRVLVGEIERCRRRDEPLNITAVKRRHPRLMEAVYAVKPFWGWRAALEAAGLGPGQYATELLPYVTCRLCGAQKTSLTLHLFNVHTVSVEDYLLDYPHAPLIAETFLAHRWPMPHGDLPHWEKVWSAEYVLDRIVAYAQAGYLLHSFWAYRHEWRLLWNAFRFFGSWDNALTAAGLDARKIRFEARHRRAKYLDGASVAREIKRRLRAGRPLNSSALISGPSQDISLWSGGCRCFGTWAAAVAAAGLDSRQLRRDACRRNRRYPDAESVITEVRRRYRRGVPLYRRATDGEKSVDLPLRRAAVEYFGSCSRMLEVAGIDAVKLNHDMQTRRRKYPDAKAVCQEIRRRIKLGLPVASKRITDFALYTSAIRHFGAWAKALEAVGATPERVPSAYPKRLPRRYSTPESVLIEIRRRGRQRLPLGSKDLQKGPHCDDALWRTARRSFAGWYEAVAAAGIDADALQSRRWRSKLAYPTAADVLSAIQERSKSGLPLNAAGVCRGPQACRALSSSARKFFGTWRKAVCAAGLNYAAIRRRRPARHRNGC